MMSGVVIIGAGECGVRAAFALRDHGYSGEVTLIGAEAALPYERPPLSKSGDIRPIRSAEAYSDNQIALRLGDEVIHIDPGNRLVSLSGADAVAYDHLLLATGARARLFPGWTAALPCAPTMTRRSSCRV